MDFDSHISRVTTVASELVNVLTPGHAHGRAYEPPTAAARRSAVAALLTSTYGEEGRRPRLRDGDVESFVRLAAQLRVVFERVEAGEIEDAAAVVNDLLRSTGARPQLDRFPGGGWSVHFHGRDDSLAVGWAAGCAAGLALALGSDFVGRLGMCDAAACDRVYVDASRNSAKRFCSQACQNRAKAAAFRARKGS